MRKIKKYFWKIHKKYLLNVVCKLYMILYKLYHVQLCLGMRTFFYSPDLTWVFLTLFDLKILIITRNGFKNDCDDKMTTKWPQTNIACAIPYPTYIRLAVFGRSLTVTVSITHRAYQKTAPMW